MQPNFEKQRACRTKHIDDALLIWTTHTTRFGQWTRSVTNTPHAFKDPHANLRNRGDTRVELGKGAAKDKLEDCLEGWHVQVPGISPP